METELDAFANSPVSVCVKAKGNRSEYLMMLMSIITSAYHQRCFLQYNATLIIVIAATVEENKENFAVPSRKSGRKKSHNKTWEPSRPHSAVEAPVTPMAKLMKSLPHGLLYLKNVSSLLSISDKCYSACM